MTLIHRPKKAVFVHVPRTGGGAIAEHLRNHGFARLKARRPHAPLDAVDEPCSFAFGFVRNPWDRMLSLYHLLCQDGRHGTYDRAALRRMGFRRWLFELDKRTPQPRYGINPKTQIRSQLRWVEGCDFIGRFERLETDFAVVCERLGVRFKTLPRVSSHMTKHPHYREIYDDQTAALVAKWFARDIERWGYEF